MIRMNKNLWNNIKNIDDCFISYLLYKEGKSVEVISIIRNESVNKIEQDLIRSRIFIQQRENKGERDFLLDIMSLTKGDRIDRINSLSEAEESKLVEEIYSRYTSFKTVEDRMILIWLIGELKSDRLLPFLRMELKSNRFNQKRLACSALGKLARQETRPWLHPLVDDPNPQVRQYAIKALGTIGNEETLGILRNRYLGEDKDYVKKAIEEASDLIKDKLNGVRDGDGKRV